MPKRGPLPFYLYRRGQVWHYKLRSEKTYHTTGQTDRDAAIDYVYNLEDWAPDTLDGYARDFFKWGVCKWIRRQHAKDKSFSQAVANQRRKHLEKYILPEFGKRQLSDINAVTVDNWLVDLPLANQTRNHILYSFRLVLDQAVLEKKLTRNPLRDLDGFKVEAKPRGVFTLEELGIMFPPGDEMIRIWGDLAHAACFMTLATTGIRSGEVRALEWRHVIPGQGIFIEQAVKPDETIGPTKSGEVRVVPPPARTMELIKRWRGETNFAGDTDLLFWRVRQVTRGRTPWHRRHLSNRLIVTLKTLEIDRAGRVVHSFRHTYNSIMRGAIPASTLRAVVGHKTEAMTDAYDHPTLQDRFNRIEAARPAIEDAFGE